MTNDISAVPDNEVGDVGVFESIDPVGPLRQQDGTSMVPGMRLPGNATSTWTDVRFGWVMATPGANAGEWTLSQRNPNGIEFARCSLAKRQLSCG